MTAFGFTGGSAVPEACAKAAEGSEYADSRNIRIRLRSFFFMTAPLLCLC